MWKNVSIAKKLYFIVGIMAFLIAGELLTLRFAMRTLSATRAFVGAEGMWSKAQKNAVFSLQRFRFTKNEKDYEAFLEYLKVPEGDHRARIELQKENPDMTVVREGFLAGHVHAEDIDPVVELLRRFYWISYLSRAIQVWTMGDELLFQLKDFGQAYHSVILSGNRDKTEELVGRMKNLNEELTGLEDNFSLILGQGSRWLERIVLSMLTVAVLTVESVGLTLAFLISRAISRGLNELNEVAGHIGQGDFSQTVNVQSQDEIGKLGLVVNTMGQMLQKSYGDLEQRVEERTRELAKMASENAKLYEEAKLAVQARDEFLSVASHEIKTPLTSLYLQLQRLSRAAKRDPQSSELRQFDKLAEASLAQAKRITSFLDELLDLTRLRVGKFELHREECDLVAIVSDVVESLSLEASRVGSPILIHGDMPVIGNFDPMRMRQVVTNLLSNAIKYGNGNPIAISVQAQEKGTIIHVRDQGGGIPQDQHGQIFERFERGKADPGISGLGLGLYIAEQIVKAHNGKISVESAPGKGSTFTCMFHC